MESPIDMWGDGRETMPFDLYANGEKLLSIKQE